MFSAHCLAVYERFEGKIDEVDEFLSGGIKIDLTSHELGSQQEGGRVRQELAELRDCWWLEGSTVLRAGQQLKLNYGPSLERLQAGDRVGVKRTAEGAMKILINGEDAGVACGGVAAAVRAVVSLAGGVVGVSVTSSHKVTSPAPGPGQEESQASHLADSLHSTVLEKEAGAGQQPGDTAAATVFEFHDNTGRNVALCHGNTVARRHDSYNQGLVMSARPLPRASAPPASTSPSRS